MKIRLVVDLFLAGHNARAFTYETKCGASLWIPDKKKVGNDDIWERAGQQKEKCLHVKEKWRHCDMQLVIHQISDVGYI